MLLQKGQGFKFKKPYTAVWVGMGSVGYHIITGPNPFNPKICGEEITLNAEEEFVVEEAYAAVGGWAVATRLSTGHKLHFTQEPNPNFPFQDELEIDYSD